MGTKHTKAASGACTAPAEAKVRTTIKRAVNAAGVRRVARALGLSDEATLRLAGGMPVRAGTLALAERNLANLEDA